MRGGKARPKAGFQVNVQKWLVPDSSGGSLGKKPYLDTMTESHQGSSKSSGGASAGFTDSREMGSYGGLHFTFIMCCSFQLYHQHLHLLYRLEHFSTF